MPPLRNHTHEAFCREVAGGAAPAHAWVIIGKEETSNNSARLMRRPVIVERIEELRREFNRTSGIQLRWLQEKLLPIATSDISSYFEADEAGKLKLRDVTKLPPELRAALSELRVDSDGQVTVKLWNKSDAISTLMKTSGAHGPAQLNEDLDLPDGYDFIRRVGFLIDQGFRMFESNSAMLNRYVIDLGRAMKRAPGADLDAADLLGRQTTPIEHVRALAQPLVIASKAVVERQDLEASSLLVELLRKIATAVERDAAAAEAEGAAL